MQKTNSKIKWLFQEKYFFLLIALLNLIPIFQGKFYPTMDGAAHLYNSNLIFELISGNEEISQFFSLNSEPVPNWSGHFFLTLLNSFLPAFIAEKIVLLFYFLGLPLAFRFLIKTINPKGVYLSYIIFPFTYTFMMMLGFYNFSIAIVFFIFTFGYWIKNEGHFNLKKGLILFSLLIATYFSHILVFGLFLFFLGLYIVFNEAFRSINHSDKFKTFLLNIWKKSRPIIFASILPLILFVYYFYSRNDNSEYVYLEHRELVDWIKNIRPIIGYHSDIEGAQTIKLFYVIVMLSVLAIYTRIIQIKISPTIPLKQKVTKFLKAFVYKNDFWLISAFVMLLLYFKLPDSGGAAGFISTRLAYLFFIFLITWLALQKLPKWLIGLSVILILNFNFNLNSYYKETIKDLNKTAVSCAKAGDYIEENSTVLPINFSPNWLQGHFSNYLGIDKPMIILENYEATTGYFPLILNYKDIPNMTIGELEGTSFPCLYWLSEVKNEKKKIDYVFVLGNLNSKTDSCSLHLQSTIMSNYQVVFEDEICQLFKIKSS